jgi:putative membrane protein
MGSCGWVLFHGIFWLVVLALLGRVIVLLMRQKSQHPPDFDVLKERYARGEINRDEYLEKKPDILG